MATHTDEQLEIILDKFEKVSKQLGIIPGGSTRTKMKKKSSYNINNKRWNFSFSNNKFAAATKRWLKNLWFNK